MFLKGLLNNMKKILKNAKKGNILCQSILGNLYYNGIGVKQDYNEAIEWYRSAAINGDSSSQFRLGLMYNSGIGVERDPIEAMRWFKKSALQGYSIANLYLSLNNNRPIRLHLFTLAAG